MDRQAEEGPHSFRLQVIAARRRASEIRHRAAVPFLGKYSDERQHVVKFWFEDCRIAECATGDQGLRKIARRPPDLLITDYAHPGPRPEEMLHRLLRTRIRFPVLVASAYVGEFPELQEPLLCFPGFAVEFLHKPFLAQDLKAAVLKCLSLASSH